MRRLFAGVLALLSPFAGLGASASFACDPGRTPDCCCGEERPPGPSLDAACPCGCAVASVLPDPRPDAPVRSEPPPSVAIAPPAIAETLRSPALSAGSIEAPPAPPAESPPLFLLHRDFRF